ncbi:hypothetical protein SRB5_28800 [Streptomyces sp. RB5]|uniref:FtsX-like permease family protein n=1 Tax=Streptomyces smaragdinus TaxID=2585196 RepID=A0A7K0CGY2_9ACTN|nr:FtsX-like permease family protein [Streptomyces smaragdinus]MQY12741.1 hypothetical protein [Streptomyces smaragdinus]
MNAWLRGWRVSLRIARRDALRNKGRSLLVLSMIALPIVGVGAVDITVRSSQLSTEQGLNRDIGAADARLDGTWSSGQPLLQAPDPRDGNFAPVDPEARVSDEGPPAVPDPAALVPAGATVLKTESTYGRARTEYGILHTQLRALDARSPLAEGIVTKLRGDLPREPHEVAATQFFLDESGLHVGSEVTLRGAARPYRITAAYELPGSLRTTELLGLPGAFKGDDQRESTLTSYLVSVPGGIGWDQVQRLNARGLTVLSRSVVLDPPPDGEVPFYATDQGRAMRSNDTSAETGFLIVAATVAGLAMLEICLLAGPAFAVGARRSRRQLGLVGANGGDRRHIRAVVLGGGLVLGLAAAVVGLGLGLLATLAGRPLLEDLVGKRFGELRLVPLELAGIAALAVVTGLLAAIVPAVTASRQTVLSSLTGRRGVRHTGRTLPVLGAVGVALGTAVALLGAMWSDSYLLVGAGSALAELGVVALTPLLIGAFGRLGRRLPLTPRLALRDAVRNRARTAPAVAAVLAAVAGTVAVAMFAAGDEQTQREHYEARLPDGMMYSFAYADNGMDRDAVSAAAQHTLPVARRADFDVITTRTGDDRGDTQLVVPPANECPLGSEDRARDLPAKERLRLATDDWRCEGYSSYVARTPVDAVVGDADLLEIYGIDDPAAEAALAAGKAVAFGPRFVEDGRIGVGVWDEATQRPRAIASIPAHRSDAKAGQWLGVVVPPAAVQKAGLATRPFGSYFTTERAPDSRERQAFDKEVADLGAESDFYIERGFVPERGFVQYGLLGFAALVTVGAAGIATGLAQADAEADLRTLAAVGAAPRVRRTLSGLQCAVVAAMGVVLGSLAGVLPAIGLMLADERIQLAQYRRMLAEGQFMRRPDAAIVVPWDTLALLLVAVPLGAGLLAALVTRSRPGIARRAEA